MTCKDCIRYDACIAYNGGMTRTMSMKNKAEKDCGLFKNKADYAEVKHGEWSLKHIGVGHYWECSECEFKNAVMPPTNYCPHCGAKMDGRSDG